MTPLAYFISPHGFGHAARAAAVMSALHTQDPALQFEIFTASHAGFLTIRCAGISLFILR